MSENKYHTSKSGFLTACSAEVRACPRGSQHYTQSEYEKLVAENDIRVRPRPSKITKDKSGYFYKAERAYAESVKRVGNLDKALSARKKEIARLFRKNGLKMSEEKNYYKNVEITKNEMLGYAQKIYKEEGVHPLKAQYITEDMSKSADPSKPIAKRRDSRDPDISAKTKRAVSRLNTDPEYAKLQEAYKAAAFKNAAANSIHEQATGNLSAYLRNSGGGALGDSNRKEVEGYQKAKAWLAAKIPASGKEHHISTVTSEMLSVGKDGNINNAWVQYKDGTVEKIVSYSPNEKVASYAPVSAPGALVTETGNLVNHTTHYHSYTSTEYGTSHIIIADKKGNDFPDTPLALQGFSDTSG